MSFFSSLFRPHRDDRAALVPLWHRIVGIAREPKWYSHGGIADTLEGRFDAVTLVLSLVLLRMERDPALIPPSARLTELFVEDMDGQLRDSGVGDLVVGKKIGRLMSVLGGRLGAYREGLAVQGTELDEAVGRNVSLNQGADPATVAAEMRAIARQLEKMPPAALLAGEIAR